MSFQRQVGLNSFAVEFFFEKMLLTLWNKVFSASLQPGQRDIIFKKGLCLAEYC